jgi:hypothetical protein
LRVVDVRDVSLWLLAMMMESAIDIATKRSARFSLMMENPSINATNRNIEFAFNTFYF